MIPRVSRENADKRLDAIRCKLLDGFYNIFAITHQQREQRCAGGRLKAHVHDEPCAIADNSDATPMSRPFRGRRRAWRQLKLGQGGEH